MHATYIRVAILMITAAGILQLAACSSATWEDAQEADTYEAYQAYIEANPNGEHIAKAQIRADSLYWNSIKNDTTAAAIQKYLDEFPNGEYRSEAQTKLRQLSPLATKGRVTGSSIIIRSDHTTESSSVGVVAKEGTVVQVLDQYSVGNSNEAILKRNLTVVKEGNQITLSNGKAMRILADRNDSVHVSFSTNYGAVETTVSKDNIEAMSGQTWYKIKTNDNIVGWIYGKFLEEL